MHRANGVQDGNCGLQPAETVNFSMLRFGHRHDDEISLGTCCQAARLLQSAVELADAVDPSVHVIHPLKETERPNDEKTMAHRRNQLLAHAYGRFTAQRGGAS